MTIAARRLTAPATAGPRGVADVEASATERRAAALEAVALMHGIVRDVPGVFALTARGAGMADALVADGDVVLLQAVREVADGDLAAVRVAGGPTRLRRVYRDDDLVILQPENRRLRAEQVSGRDVRVVGRVIAIARGGGRDNGAVRPNGAAVSRRVV